MVIKLHCPNGCDAVPPKVAAERAIDLCYLYNVTFTIDEMCNTATIHADTMFTPKEIKSRLKGQPFKVLPIMEDAQPDGWEAMMIGGGIAPYAEPA